MVTTLIGMAGFPSLLKRLIRELAEETFSYAGMIRIRFWGSRYRVSGLWTTPKVSKSIHEF